MPDENDVPILDAVSDEIETPYTYTITSYGADYPVDGLVKRIKDGSILVPAFQRGYVWDLTRASRFIESLLLGLPVPGIFLAKDPETQKLWVVDGQQRLWTLQYFYEGVFAGSGRVFALKGVDSRFLNATYKSLRDEDRRRLDDAIIHATIVRQDQPSEDESSIYKVFERLNTGGVQLTAQEIRSCIYEGPCRDLLRDLNENPAWRQIFGPPSKNQRDQELILRFLALYFDGDKYTQPMKGFLNTFMGRNRHLKRYSREDIAHAFNSAIEKAFECFGKQAFRRQNLLNAALVDSVMIGLARRLSRGPINDCVALRERYTQLLMAEEFVAATETGTSAEQSVNRRIEMASAAFSEVR
jgi:hypothetical protein